MSKYLRKLNDVDFHKIDEDYSKLIENQTEEAKEDSQKLLETIRYYRTHSFEEIEADIRKEVSSEEEIEYIMERRAREKAYEELGSFYKYKKKHPGKDYNALHKEYVSLEEKLIEKYSTEYTEEEKTEAIEEEVQHRLYFAREQDITYDLLTEEQISKLVELKYIYVLKEGLVWAKGRALKNYASAKFERHKYSEQDIDQEVLYMQEIVKVDFNNEQEEHRKEDIKHWLEEFLEMVKGYGGFAAIFGGGATLLTTLVLTATQEFSFIESLAGSALSLAAALAVVGSVPMTIGAVLCAAGCLSEKKNDEKVLAFAKEHGFYDAYVELLKAEKEYEDYQDELFEHAKGAR